jgi:hypothetical protein
MDEGLKILAKKMLNYKRNDRRRYGNIWKGGCKVHKVTKEDVRQKRN